MGAELPEPLETAAEMDRARPAASSSRAPKLTKRACDRCNLRRVKVRSSLQSPLGRVFRLIFQLLSYCSATVNSHAGHAQNRLLIVVTTSQSCERVLRRSESEGLYDEYNDVSTDQLHITGLAL